MATKHNIKLFISSPSDVTSERDIIQNTLEDEIAVSPSFREKCSIQVIRFDNPSKSIPFYLNENPQATINNSLSKPSDCDLCIGIIWNRMGTPLSNIFTKPDGSTYRSGTEWEITEAINSPTTDVILYHKTADATIPYEDDKLGDFLNQRKISRSFISQLKINPAVDSNSIIKYSSIDDLKKRVRSDLEEAIFRILDREIQTDNNIVSLSEGANNDRINPEHAYVGMRPLNQFEENIFFGREEEKQQIIDMAFSPENNSQPIVITGPSGIGKSSLLAAGVCPVFSNYGFNVKYIRSNSNLESTLDELEKGISENPSMEHSSNLEIIRNLIVLDQIENMKFYFARDYTRIIKKFFELAAIPNNIVILSFRIDFVSEIIRNVQVSNLIQSNSLFLGPPSDASLRSIIVKPAAASGVEIDSQLTHKLIEFFKDNKFSLPMLSLLMKERFCSDEDGNYRLDIPKQAGWAQVEAIFEGYFSDVSKRIDPEEKLQLKELFPLLVECDDKSEVSCRRVRVDDLNEMQLIVVMKLVEMRIISLGSDAMGYGQIEFSHESVLRSWSLLRDWIEEYRAILTEQKRIEIYHRHWTEEGQPKALLLPAPFMKSGSSTHFETLAKANTSLLSYVSLSREHLVQEIKRDSERFAEVALTAFDRHDVVGAAVYSFQGLRPFLEYNISECHGRCFTIFLRSISSIECGYRYEHAHWRSALSNEENYISFHDKRTCLAFANRKGECVVRDFASKRDTRITLLDGESTVHGIELLSDIDTVLFILQDGVLFYNYVNNLTLARHKFEGHVESFCISTGGSFNSALFLTSRGKHYQVDLDDGFDYRPLMGVDKRATAIQFNSMGDGYLVGSENGNIYQCSFGIEPALLLIDIPSRYIARKIFICTHTNYVYVLTRNNLLYRVRYAGDDFEVVFNGFGYEIVAVKYLNGYGKLVAIFRNGKIILIDPNSGQISELRGHVSSQVCDVAFCSDGGFLILSYMGKNVEEYIPIMAEEPISFLKRKKRLIEYLSSDPDIMIHHTDLDEPRYS